MRTLWILFVLCLGLTSQTWAAAPTDCGDTPETAPVFTLVDRNPSSPTYEQEINTADFMGRVWVVYWAQAS